MGRTAAVPGGRADDAWRKGAACAGAASELFFPPEGIAYPPEARATCDACGVVAECLEYALATHQGYGMWGGLTPKQRRSAARARADAAARTEGAA